MTLPLRRFLTESKPSRRSITTAKRKEKEKKERRKKFSKIGKPKDISHFFTQKLKILISAHARARISPNAMLVARTPSCRLANAFSTRLKLILPKSSLKTAKMSKKHVFCKKLQESIDCFHDPIMQHVLWGSLHKNNTSCLLLGLYHASVN